MDVPGDDIETAGPFETRYLAFLETINQIRPRLHRYCSRMTGSALDGEDIVQEALFQAYRKLDTFDESRSLNAWLFGIAHNRCIDFLRSRAVRREAEAEAVTPDWIAPAEPVGPELGRAVEHLVLSLPPLERACVLLKDVFDYSLEEIAGLVDSTVGGVKAALNRGRSKLTSPPPAKLLSPPRTANSERLQLLRLYVERFNRRDWDGLRELIAHDARLRVADRFVGRLDKSPYFGNYARRSAPWQMCVGEVDGETVVLCLEQTQGRWIPISAIRLEVADGHIDRVADYTHCPWVLPAATSILVA